MIDADGFRANIGIIIMNEQRKLFWARRVGNTGWQFPQGGMQDGETPLDAMYRELAEETGLQADQVELLQESRRWLRYRLPEQYLRHNAKPLCIGQKQRWFLLKFKAGGRDIDLAASSSPEFDQWRWVDYWEPVRQVVHFKRRVYRAALGEFVELVHPAGKLPKTPSL